jgi:serine/threonine-protein kinase
VEHELTENQRIIAGRYEVGTLIGRGGMADVYEGVDTRLGRTVAIKLLKSDLANDPSFETRFRQEAQASARMSHPTIVRVYDAGEETTKDIHGNEHKFPFIIMEYVRGELLRDLLHQRRLTKQEILEYTSGVLTALEFSHRAGVVHRDIKSANIMINEAGQVKVMDFGIARAVSDSSATMAHTSGIVGTAQYFSPEQAKGETVDSRTDLYSTGVLLYEMLTGRPPFKGETAVSVAYQHVSEAVVLPSTLDDSISPEIDQVVLRALAKDREERFQTAEEFREHLIAAFNGSPESDLQPAAQAEPVVEAEAPVETDASDLSSIEELFAEPAIAETPVASATDLTEVMDVADDDFEALLGGAGFDRTTAITTPPIDVTGKAEAKSEEKTESYTAAGPATNPFNTLGIELPSNTGPSALMANLTRPSKNVLWGVGSGILVLLIGLLVWLVTISNDTVPIDPNGGGISVADVSNLSYDVAFSTLTEQGLLVAKVMEASDTVPANSVIRTDPVPGTKVAKNTTISLYVSSGANTVKVPNLAGMTEADAKTALEALKLVLGTITQANSATVPKGQVIESAPVLNSPVAEGSAVNIVVSDGQVMLPNVINLGLAAAQKAVSAPGVGLPYTSQVELGCTGKQGTLVVRQSPEPGLVPQGTPVTLFLECVGATTVSPSPSPTQ